MKSVAYNYSSIKNKETKIYAINGTVVSSSGVNISFLAVVLPSTILFTIIGVLIDKIFNLHMYELKIEMLNYIAFTSGIGIIIGLILWFIQIQNYRLYEYLFARLLPKFIYTTDGIQAKRLKYYKIKINSKIGGMF